MSETTPDFRDRLVAYLNSIDEYRDEGSYSGLWSNFIREFTMGGRADVDSLRDFYRTKCRGYVPRPRMGGDVDWQARVEHAVGWTVNAIYAVAETAARYLKGKRVRYRYDWRTYRTKSFLESVGVDYRARLDEGFPVAPLYPTFFSLRAVWYEHLLLQYTDFGSKGPRRILEVGAGVGTLAAMLARKFRPQEYVVIDLAEMLPVFAMEVARHFPDCRIVFPHEERPGDGDENIVTFVLRTPTQAESIGDREIDLALNVDSFAEMPFAAAQGYVTLFNRVLAPGGIMFLANRESRPHKGQKEINSMWTLPYDTGHEVLLMEHCPMRHAVMGGRTPNINRISRK